MEEFILSLQSVDPLVVYSVVFAIAFVENVFPPSPSDLVVVFAGALVNVARIGFLEALLAATAGSATGFLVMYKIGDWFGQKILERGKVKFISLDAIRKVEDWFRKYGYGIIIANRFLAGTRAVVSFFAGMSELRLLPTFIFSFLSALAWNAILLVSGYYLGNNWHRIGFYLSTYSQVVTAIVVIVVLLLAGRYFYRKKNSSDAG